MYLYFSKNSFSVKVTEGGKKALMELGSGDMRKVLNILQGTATAFPEVNEDNVYTCVGHPTPTDMSNVLNWLLNSDFTTAYNSKYLHFNALILLM